MDPVFHRPKSNAWSGMSLGLIDEPGRDAVDALVDEVARLRRGVDEAHVVRSAPVPELARRVVALGGEERLDGAAHVRVHAAEELGQVVVAGRDVDVVVTDDERRHVDGDVHHPLRVGERVEPDVL